MAELLLDEGKFRQAQVTSTNAAEEIVKEKAARDAARAYAILSQIFLREDDLVAARNASERAGAYLSKCSDREAELMVTMSEARAQALTSALARDDAARTFHEIASKADRLGFVR